MSADSNLMETSTSMDSDSRGDSRVDFRGGAHSQSMILPNGVPCVIHAHRAAISASLGTSPTNTGNMKKSRNVARLSYSELADVSDLGEVGFDIGHAFKFWDSGHD